jgi:hypothetical protein
MFPTCKVKIIVVSLTPTNSEYNAFLQEMQQRNT